MLSTMQGLSAIPFLLGHPHVGRELIAAYRNRRLRSLIDHAYKNVPYYRELFDRNGLRPDDIQRVEDLAAMPITTRSDLQSTPVDKLMACGTDPERMVCHTTSGSSGQPLTIRRTWLEERLHQAFQVRAFHCLGRRVTDRQVMIELVRPARKQRFHLLFRALRTLGVFPRDEIHCLLPVEEITQRLRDLRPDVILGFAGVVSRVAEYLIKSGRTDITPRVIHVVGEVLTPLMRRQIKEAFSAPVYDLYACREFQQLAWECKETGEYHVCDDSVVLEVLKDGRPVAEGERGEVVGTDLNAFSMPFIRYRLGDVVTKGAEVCRCGHPFSTIRAIQGRMIDYFHLPDGRSIHPYEVVTIVVSDENSWIRQYQLVQERENRVVLRVVPRVPVREEDLERISERVASVLGPMVELQVVLVPEISLEASGKFRVSRSLVRSNYDGIEWDRQYGGSSA